MTQENGYFLLKRAAPLGELTDLAQLSATE